VIKTPRMSSVVPYIATWSEEAESPATLVLTPGGIGYKDENPLLDRDARGVLWVRHAHQPGKGRPDFGGVNTLRQRRVMSRFLCQVCAGPASRTNEGLLFLLSDQHNGGPDWPEEEVTAHPPLCLRCAGLAVRLCPHLGDGYVAVRASRPEVVGVVGRLYNHDLSIRESEGLFLHSRRDLLSMVVATQLLGALQGCTVIDLKAELSAARLPV